MIAEYLFTLYDLDFRMFDSWHIVSSSTATFESIVENEIRSNHGLKYLIVWLESGCAIDIHAQGAVAWLSSLNPLGEQQENVVVSNSVTVQGSRAI